MSVATAAQKAFDLERMLGSAANWISETEKSKLFHLFEIIGKYQSVVLGFSGGVDSTFLAWACKVALGEKALLVTAISETYPSFEREEAEELAKKLGMRQTCIHTDELNDPRYAANPADRCYYCKSELFRAIAAIAKEEGHDGIFEGGNINDLSDYRPGRTALKELGIASPLIEAGLTKDEIRTLSKAASLPTGNKPSYACLASRFPYGEHLDREKLKRVEDAEAAIRALGFTQFRVRSHSNLARIEFTELEMDKGWELRKTIVDACKKAGYIFVTIDLAGYRTGAMNEMLTNTTILP